MRVLDQVTGLTVYNDEMGQRYVMRHNVLVCDERMDTKARAVNFALDAGKLCDKTVAWIGGGLCLGPRLFATAGAKQTVYEIEPAFAEFCPHDITFVLGDFKQTFQGMYDLIIYDLGGEAPDLSAHLKPNGRVLHG